MTSQRVTLAVLVAASLFLGSQWTGARGSVSAATNLTLTPVADTYVLQSSPSTAYGAAAQLIVDGTPVSRAFIRFDLSGVSGTVTAATLRLHVANTSSSGSPAGGTIATTTNLTWSEGSTTWNSRPTVDGPALGALGTVSRNSWAQRDVMAAVKPGGVTSFAITSTNSDGAYYDSREAGALAPQLVLTMDTVTPPPPPGNAVTLNAVADAYLAADAPSTAYGMGPQLIADGSPVRETLIRFDLSSLAGPVQSARLKLHVANISNAGSPDGGLIARVANTAWNESTVTYASRPTQWGPSVATLGAVSANTWVEADVTAAVTTGAVLTLGVRTTNSDGAYYDSREVTASAPRLIVTLGTPPPPVTGIVIAAVGDAVCAPGSAVTATTCRQKSISDLIVNDPAIGLVLMLGDLQYENGALAAFQSAYDPTYGRVKAKTKPAPGNHEYGTAGAAGYYAYFGAAAGDPAKGYYSFDVGTAWHVIALNSNCSNVPCGAGSAQEQWLRGDLAASGRPCTLAYWHHPRFSSGSSHGDNPSVAPFWDALQQYGAEVALAGHEHQYERFAPQLATGVGSTSGIAEFVVGGGGHSLHGFATPKANSVLRLSAFGILRLTLGDGVYAWQLIGENGGTLDSGTAACH